MYEKLCREIGDHVVLKQQRTIPFAPASELQVGGAEKSLGLAIPEMLRALYLQVGNGGFGPGRGGTLIGVEGGYASSPGTLVEQYEDIIRGAEYLGLSWPRSLLPFCEWGCNIFSCVNVGDPDFGIYLAQDCDAQMQHYNLSKFLEMWLQDIDILDVEPKRRTKIRS